MSSQSIGMPISVASAPAQVRRTSFVNQAKLIGVLTLLSRILGMARESVVALYFGAGTVSSAFAVAFKVPNLFRKLLGEGALSAAFIPLYAQAIKTDRREADRFAAASVSFLVTLLLAITLVGEAGLFGLTRLIQLRPDDLLIVRFTAIMLPYVLLVCTTAFLGGILQVHDRFALPAIAPVLLNLIHIGVIVIGARMLLLQTAPGDAKLAIQTRLAYWLAAFVLVAGIMQVAMLLPSLRAVGFSTLWVTRFWTPAVKRMVKLSVPVALSAGVLQLSVIVDTTISVVLTGKPTEHLHILGWAFAYPLAPGAVARLNWAQLLYQFPLGIFAIALATAIFPTLSADAMETDRRKFRQGLHHGIRIALLEGLPASLGLIIVRYPAIRLLYQHGSFTAADTVWVARSTIFFSAAIWAFALQQIMNRAFYALHDTMTPLIMSIATMAVNTVVEIPLVFTKLGESGMAAGTLASFAVQGIVMLWMLDRRVGGLNMPSLLRSIAKMIVACGVMVVVCQFAEKLPGYPHGSGTLSSVAQLAILVTAGGASYLATCQLLGIRLKYAG